MIPLSITAVGLTSSFGTGSEDACAAALAGLARLSPIDTINTTIDPLFAKETIDGVPSFCGHVAPVVGLGHAGLGKLMALGRPALEEVVRKCERAGEDLSRTGLCIATSDRFFQQRFGTEPEPLGQQGSGGGEAGWTEVVSQLSERLCAVVGLSIPRSLQWVSREGRLGPLSALEQASQWLSRGALDSCLIGAIDSFVEPSALMACGAAQVLKTDANPVGFMPGEAAAFLLVKPAATAGPRHGSVRLLTMTRARDAAYLDPDVQPFGRGISEVIHHLVADTSRLPTLLVTDLNGTEFRASDWGHALVRLAERLGELGGETWFPVESFGETGAATGVLALCLMAEAASRGHMVATSAILVLCAEGGGRGGLAIEIEGASLIS